MWPQYSHTGDLEFDDFFTLADKVVLNIILAAFFPLVIHLKNITLYLFILYTSLFHISHSVSTVMRLFRFHDAS